MKPLFWKRIQVDLVKHEKALNLSSKLFCEGLQEAVLDLDEFDHLFSKSPIQLKKKGKESKASAKSVQHYVQAAKVIDAKRSQAVGILLSTIRLEMSAIQHAILHLDTSLLDLEKFRAIHENRPQDNEIKLIRAHVDKQTDVPLDKPEQFLFDLSQMPQYSERIFCFIFQSTFQESMSVIENKLNNLKMTCEMLTASKSVKQIFGLLLAFGNYMNGGSCIRGQADGFELDILPKLKDYRAKDSRTSLINYLVRCYVQLYETSETGTESVRFPLPEPSDLTQASLVDFDDITKELDRIQRDFRLAKFKADYVLDLCSVDNRQPFESMMKLFFRKGQQELEEQRAGVMESRKTFENTVQYFMVKVKSGGGLVTPEFFYSLWLLFCQDFKDQWKGEQQAVIKRRLRNAEGDVRRLQACRKVSVVPAL